MIRYESMHNTHDNPNLQFMVWDWEENTNICYCANEINADRIASALNCCVL